MGEEFPESIRKLLGDVLAAVRRAAGAGDRRAAGI